MEEGQKLPIIIKKESNERGNNSLDLKRYDARRKIALKIDIGVGSFYE
jgi:hypothetical protein